MMQADFPPAFDDDRELFAQRAARRRMERMNSSQPLSRECVRDLSAKQGHDLATAILLSALSHLPSTVRSSLKLKQVSHRL